MLFALEKGALTLNALWHDKVIWTNDIGDGCFNEAFIILLHPENVRGPMLIPST